MKTIILIIYTLIILQACDEPNDKNAKSIHFQFFVKNISTKNVSVNLFLRNNELIFNNINIGVMDSILVDEGNIDPVGGCSYHLTNSIDSAEILFSDDKKLMQICCERGINDTINNILTPVFYKGMVNRPKETMSKMMFTITEADHLRAK